MIEFIETVLLYKFPQMSREEIKAIFTLGDLKKTRFYRDTKLEGKLEGEKIGTQRSQVLGLKQFAVKLLTRKFGKVSLKTVKRLDKLSAEELAESVLDFEKVADLEAWLASKK